MTEPVLLDASAVLALMFGERGAEGVASSLGSASVSAVNAAEVTAKLIDKGLTPAQAEAAMTGLLVPILPLGAKAGIVAGQLRTHTKQAGLSLGDRACLAQALVDGHRVVTADRVWADLDIGVEVEVIR